MTEKRRLNVLIVEDSPDDALLLADALRKGGFVVIERRVESAVELREEIENREWDLVLCDNNMPDLDASSALEIVRRIRPEIPFIIVFGGISEEEASGVMKRGASDYISKHNLSRLVPAVGRELARYQDLALANTRIGELTRYDGATGLPNRQHLTGFLDSILKGGKNAAVILVELCRYSELLNHAAEASLLKAVAENLSSLNHGGMIGRTYEDRVAVIFQAGSADIEACTRNIVESFRRPIRIDGEDLFVELRAGSSVSSGVDAETLLGQAETALHCARNKATAEACFYSEWMERKRRERFDLEKALSRAVINGEFTLAYQPQFELESRKIIGAEALLRWNNQGEWISPAEFIPILEETRQILMVGEWILRKACETARRWQLQGLPRIRMAVNLSAVQFRQPDLAEKIGIILDETGLDPGCLALEITENIAMHRGPEIVSTLQKLKMQGIELALDDFGTGYSSLSYIKHFPIRKLKIDQTFIRDMMTDKCNEAIVRAILMIASSLDLGVIAEGVETIEQIELLRDCGCSEAQGYFFSRPVWEDDMMALLREEEVRRFSMDSGDAYGVEFGGMGGIPV